MTKKKGNSKSCALVLGMHRSGTSTLAGLLSSIGLHAGTHLLAASDSNPKGHFENYNIYELNKKILANADSSWDSHDFDISQLDSLSIRQYIDQAKSIIKQDFSFIEYFTIKEPRMCLLFPIWQTALEELNITVRPLLIFRNPMEIALSLQKRNGFSLEKGLILWMHYSLQAEYHSRNYQRTFISYDDLIYKTPQILKEIEDFLSINLSETIRKEAVKFPDQGIKHNRLIQNTMPDAPPIYTRLYELYLSDQVTAKKIDKIRDDFYNSLSFYQYKEIIEDISLSKKESLLIKDENSYLKQKQEETRKEYSLLKGKITLLEQEQETTIKKYEQEQETIVKKYEQEQETIVKNYEYKLHEYAKIYVLSNSLINKLIKKKIMISHKLVDVVIPIYNAIEYAENCIASVIKNENGLISQIIVVDDGSDSATSIRLTELAKQSSLVHLITLSTNKGYTKAVNTGIKQSSANYVVLLNSDTIVSADWLEKMIRCAESDEKIGIVGPLSNAASWQSVPSLLDQDGNFKVNELPENISVEQMADMVENASICAYPHTPFVNGFCFLIKRQVIDEIGIMDEDNFPIGYGEENDYSIRAQDAGFSLSIADDTYVYHAKSKSFGHSQRMALSARGSKALKDKHGKNKVGGLVKKMKNNKVLDAVRSSVAKMLDIYQIKVKINPSDLNILFILPSPGVGGGSHSIVQEVVAMQNLGINAKIGIEEQHLTNSYQRYKDIDNVKYLFVGYKENTLLALAKSFDVVIATIYYSSQIVKRITGIYPHILPAYYVQDYEPMFFEKGTGAWKEARTSYTLVDNMLLFAKTSWIAREVAQHHGISVRKVVPSIDHIVYHPSVVDKKEKQVIYLAAMVRPQTPRRGAERTMKVLASLKYKYDSKVEIQIFGCEDSDLEFKKLKRDFNFRNLGVLDRPSVSSCLQVADIFIDLSDYQAFGRTSLEAMACGATAVVPCFGGGDEYAIDGYNSLVVDPFDESECISRLEILINNPRLLTKMKKAALETAEKYTPQKAALSELKLIADNLSVHRNTYPKHNKPIVSLIPVRRKDGEPVGSAFVRLLQPYGNNSELLKDWDVILHTDVELPVPSQADIVIIQRDALGQDVGKVINWLLFWRAAGKKIIFELDDDLFDVNGLVRRTGNSRKKIKQLVSVTKKLATLVDAVVVSTPQLFQITSEYNKSVFLIPNYLDPKLWGILGVSFKPHPNRIKTKIKNNKVVKIGYIGTPTHDSDLLIIQEAMERIKHEYGTKVEIEVIGAFQKKLNKPLFGKAVALPKNTTYPKFVEWLRIRVDWDIAVIPLVDDQFNQSKSHLKFLECTALGLASICSNVSVYSSIVRHGENGLLVKNTTEDWYQAIKLLIDDVAYREKLSRNAYLALSNNYTTRVNTNLYHRLLSEVNELEISIDSLNILRKENNRKKGLLGMNLWHSYIEADSRRKKLYAKFKNTPYAYFADSKNMFLRPMRFLFRKK